MRYPKQVYISHTQGDKEIALAVSGELFKHDIKVWDSHLSLGSNWVEVVKKALDSSDAVIAILSEHSYSSSWVRSEVEHALFNEKFKSRFFPVLISRDYSDLSRLPWVLQKIQHLHLSPDKQASFLGREIAREFLKFVAKEQ